MEKLISIYLHKYLHKFIQNIIWMCKQHKKNINEIVYIIFLVLSLWKPLYILHSQYILIWAGHMSNAPQPHVAQSYCIGQGRSWQSIDYWFLQLLNVFL